MNQQHRINDVVVFGHYPPPVTGERLCCLHLISRLRTHGYAVEAAGKREGLLASRPWRTAWLILGSRTSGFWRDCLILLRQRRVPRIYVYVHNASWRRLLLFRLLLRPFFGTRMRPVVLTEEIARRLAEAGYRPSVLRNTMTATELDGLGSVAQARRLVWMAAISKEKGFLVAYEAFEHLGEGWTFDVYGSGLPAERFPRARFHGVVSGEAKRAAFAMGGILLLPSFYRNETQPLCLIESLSVGMPVVASRIGGIPEIVGEGDGAAGLCLLRPGGDVLAEAIKKVYRDYGRYAEAATRRFARYFSGASFDRELLAIMQTQEPAGSIGENLGVDGRSTK